WQNITRSFRICTSYRIVTLRTPFDVHLFFSHRNLPSCVSRTPRRAPARIALHAGAVAHQREIPAFAAHFAFIALGPGFGAALRLARRGGRCSSGAAPLQGFELFRGREVVLGFLLQCDRAFGGVGGAGGGERHYVAAL